MLPEYAQLRVRVLDVAFEDFRDKSEKDVMFKVAIGHQRYRLHSVDPDTQLTFHLTLHAHLFYILQIDFYRMKVGLLRRREHKGRVQIRVRLLETISCEQERMTGWWEMRSKDDCFLPLDELGVLPADPRNHASVGLIKLELFWTRTVVTSSNLDFTLPIMAIESVHRVAEAERVRVSDSTDCLVYDIDTSRVDSPVSSSGDSTVGQLIGEDSIKRAIDEDKKTVELQVSASTAWLRRMAGFVMSGDDYKAFVTVHSLSLAFNQGIEVSGGAMLRSFLLLQRYFGLSHVKLNHELDNVKDSDYKQELVLAIRLYRFVIASFGWLGVTYAQKGKTLLRGMRPMADQRTVMEYLKLAEGDLILSNFGDPKAFRPVYFVARDGPDKLIVSIRGTLHANDALTDLVCDYVEWRGGHVHSGMLAAAMFVYGEILSVLREEMRGFKRRLYITGHSMGGATAVLLTMLLQDEYPDVTCVSFGSPPLVSESLTTNPNISVFVNGDDAVPRLCYGSAVDLQSLLLYCTMVSKSAWMFGGELPKPLVDNLDQFRQLQRQRSRSIRLCHPGRLFHINTTTMGNQVRVSAADNRQFEELLPTRRLIFDHLPDQYEKALDAAYIGCLMRQLESKRLDFERCHSADPVVDSSTPDISTTITGSAQLQKANSL